MMSGKCKLKYPFIDGYKDLPKDKDNELREIKKWIETQPQLPKLNDEFLHLFLYCNYYNIQETQKNIHAYHSLRSTSPEIFQDRSVSDPKLRTAFNTVFLATSPKRTSEGYQIIFGAFNETNVKNFVHVDVAKAAFMFLDVVISESGLCPGYVVVLDAKFFGLSVFLKLNWSGIMKIIRYFQDAASVRVVKIIVINAVPLAEKLYSLCRPFMNAKLIDKIELYATGSDLTKFHQTVPLESFYEDFGGTAGTVEAAHDNFMKLLETKYSEWIDDESIYAVEEPKKEPKPAKRSYFSFW